MKFAIEIYGTAADGSDTLLNRSIVSAITPLGARKQARQLLALWKKRGAKSARLFNVQGEIVYKLIE